MISIPSLRTQRLELVAGNVEMAQAELHDKNKLASLLMAEVPDNWPPPLNDAQSAKWFADYLTQNPDAVGWIGWYFILTVQNGRRAAIGNGGFKGKPDLSGTVEIGYSIMEQHQRKGYAPEAVTALLAWAFAHSDVKRIIAQTFPDLHPSIRVLEKSGFLFAGKGLEEGAILFELPREKWVGQPVEKSS